MAGVQEHLDPRQARASAEGQGQASGVGGLSVGDGMDVEPLQQALREALAGLDARERQLLTMHYVERKTPEQMGAVVRLPPGTAARHMAQARARLLVLVRERLSSRMPLEDDALDSLLLLVQRNLEADLRALLR